MPFADAGRPAGPLWVYSLLVVLAAALFLLARNLVRSGPGRALVAVRDHQTSAAACGVPVALYKAVAFGVSAMYGGIAGSMLMMNRPFVSDVQFGTKVAIFLVVGLVIGGAGTISGSVAGCLRLPVRAVPRPAVDLRPERHAARPAPAHRAAVRLAAAGRRRRRRHLLRARAAGADVRMPGGFVAGFRMLRARLVTVVPNPPWMADVVSGRRCRGTIGGAGRPGALDAAASR